MVRKAKVEFDESPPDDFDPKNPYGDPVAMLEYREHLVREKWIQIETAKIIRDRLRWCYRIEGVNHHQKCRHLVDSTSRPPAASDGARTPALRSCTIPRRWLRPTSSFAAAAVPGLERLSFYWI